MNHRQLDIQRQPISVQDTGRLPSFLPLSPPPHPLLNPDTFTLSSASPIFRLADFTVAPDLFLTQFLMIELPTIQI